jgi:glycosyltransferase involved in cell wall biosynthesis
VKVLMLTHDFPPQALGGEGVFASAIATRLCDRGIDLEVVAPRTTGDAAHDVKLGFKVHRVGVVMRNFATRTLSFAWSSRHLVRSYQGDVIYAFRPVVRPQRPMLSHFHVTRAGQARAARMSGQWVAALANGLFAPVDRRQARISARVIGVNEAMRAELGCVKRQPEEFQVVQNGVDTALFSEHGRPSPQGFRLLFVGRLDPLKRVPDLLHAVATLAASHPGLSLTVVGSGREYRNLLALTRSLGIEERVHFIPGFPHGEMPAVYRAHDLLVLPSVYESFGMVILEAMACGTPALTSDACAQLGQPCFPAGSVSALVESIAQLAHDRDRLSELSSGSRETAIAHSWDRVAAKVEEQLRTGRGTGRR